MSAEELVVRALIVGFIIAFWLEGVGGIVCGVTGLVIAKKRRRTGGSFPVALNIVFPIALVIGVLSFTVSACVLAVVVAAGMV